MFYTFFLLIIFTFILLIKKPDNREYVWIVLSITGFCVAILAFAFYIFELNEYFKIKTAYFDFSNVMWFFLNFIKLDPYTINRLLNLGAVTFVFSLLNFSYLYTHEKNKKIIGFRYQILPIAFLIFYDPFVLKNIFFVAMDIKRNYFNFSFTSILSVLNWLNKVWLVYYIYLCFYWFYKDYKQHMIKRIRKKILFIMLCIIPISSLFMMMFYWFPQQIIILRERSLYNFHDSGYTYSEFSYGNFIHLPTLYKFYPVVAIISIAILIYAIYSLNVFNLFEKIQYDKLGHSFTTAGLGIKVFSHSIKNDLYAIRLLIQDCLKKDLHEQELYRIEKICESNLKMFERLNKTINVKIENIKPVNIVQCISKVIENADIPEHITLATSFQESTVEAYLDEYYFSEVVNSIIQNSIDAINISKHEGLINITVQKRNKEIILSIRDNGCGIDADRAKRVFDPFFSTKPSTKNWGMGLSYCNMVIQAFNGEIHFNSLMNEGCEVLIYLPSIEIQRGERLNSFSTV